GPKRAGADRLPTAPGVLDRPVLVRVLLGPARAACVALRSRRHGSLEIAPARASPPPAAAGPMRSRFAGALRLAAAAFERFAALLRARSRQAESAVGPQLRFAPRGRAPL